LTTADHKAAYCLLWRHFKVVVSCPHLITNANVLLQSQNLCEGIAELEVLVKGERGN
jgi:hypothetical protein